jgi:hypothetical protein
MSIERTSFIIKIYGKKSLAKVSGKALRARKEKLKYSVGNIYQSFLDT